MANDIAPDDELEDFLPRRKTPWGAIAIALAAVVSAVGAFLLYDALGQKGLSVRSPGHLVVLEKGGAWAFLADGAVVRLTDESAKRLGAKTGPCAMIDGALDGTRLAVDALDCQPGASLKRTVTERLKRVGLKFAYWAPDVVLAGPSLDEHLATVEVVAAMVDPRFEAPQLLSLWTPLFPSTLLEARQEGLPPPVILQVKRNDFLVKRFGRSEVEAFLDRKHFVLAGAGVKGGWMVRTVEVADGAEGDIERLLVAPEEAPWPKRLGETNLRVGRRRSAATEAARPVP